MTKEEFLKKSKELGIVATSAFPNGFNEDVADDVINSIEKIMSPCMIDEMVLRTDGSELFMKQYCNKCEYQFEDNGPHCPGYLPKCLYHDYEEFLQEHKDEILKKNKERK